MVSVVTGFDVVIFTFRDGETLRSRAYSGQTYVVLPALTLQTLSNLTKKRMIPIKIGDHAHAWHGARARVRVDWVVR
jgi:hypothetical protein